MSVGRLAATIAVVVLSQLASLPLAGQQQARQPGAGRAALEARFRQRVGAVVQRRLGLTNEQASQLQRANQRYEARRRDLLRTERETRAALRRQLANGGAGADQTQVARLIDALIDVNRERVQVAADEQRELSAFLTPVQRAQYFALQDELRRRMQQAQQRRAGGAGTATPD